MMTRLLNRMLLVLALHSPAAMAGSVVRLDHELDSLVAGTATLEILYRGDSGDSFEGPVWIRHPGPGYLLFTNVPGNVIDKWTPDGRVSAFITDIFTGDPATALRAGSRVMLGANGATLDREGRLIYTSYSAGEIVRLEKNGTRTVLASRYDGRSINAPNDVVARSDGLIYFTDSRMSTSETSGPDCDKFWLLCGHASGVPHKGVYFVKDGVVHLFSKDVHHPNGLAFSANEKVLYVSNTIQKNVLRFDLHPDGSGTGPSVFSDMSADPAEGAPDGIKLDIKGNVYCTGPGGIWILSPSGRHLGTILTAERSTNFTFGGEDGRALFIESATTLARIQLKVRGLR
jgi:gluconolactonase